MSIASRNLVAFKLTEKQQSFVYHTCQGCPPNVAAELAGYFGSNASESWRLLQLPHVAAAIHSEIGRLLQVEGAPLGFAVLKRIAGDDTAPKGVRVDAARTLLRLAGHVEPRSEPPKPAEKPLGEMSTDELRALVDKLEGELAGRATPVDAAIPDAVATDMADILD